MTHPFLVLLLLNCSSGPPHNQDRDGFVYTPDHCRKVERPGVKEVDISLHETVRRSSFDITGVSWVGLRDPATVSGPQGLGQIVRFSSLADTRASLQFRNLPVVDIRKPFNYSYLRPGWRSQSRDYPFFTCLYSLPVSRTGPKCQWSGCLVVWDRKHPDSFF